MGQTLDFRSGVIIVGLPGFVFILKTSTDSAIAKDIDDLLADAISWANRTYNGMLVPVEGEVAWDTPDGELSYWRGHIEAIEQVQR